VWAQLATAALGVWLTIAPGVLGASEAMRVHDRVVGPLLAAVGIVAASEVTRPLRHVALVLGAWLVLAPWLLGGAAVAVANDVAVGLATAGLSRAGARRRHRHGGGWREVAALLR
jgi:hypothetical protein